VIVGPPPIQIGTLLPIRARNKESPISITSARNHYCPMAATPPPFSAIRDACKRLLVCGPSDRTQHPPSPFLPEIDFSPFFFSSDKAESFLSLAGSRMGRPLQPCFFSHFHGGRPLQESSGGRNVSSGRLPFQQTHPPSCGRRRRSERLSFFFANPDRPPEDPLPFRSFGWAPIFFQGNRKNPFPFYQTSSPPPPPLFLSNGPISPPVIVAASPFGFPPYKKQCSFTPLPERQVQDGSFFLSRVHQRRYAFMVWGSPPPLNMSSTLFGRTLCPLFPLYLSP